MAKIKKWLVKFIGHIYIHKYPPFVIYKPMLHKVKGYQVRNILRNIKAGDLVFRRYDGYLSSKFIPGTWTHVGLCIDNERVIHSVGNGGVIKEDILTFCRTDSIAITRPMLSSNSIREARQLALKYNKSNIGYDYEFRANNGAFYCTELVNECYRGLFNNSFTEEYGNTVLTPDNLYKSDFCKKILEYKN